MVKAMARDGEATLLNSLGQRQRRTVVPPQPIHSSGALAGRGAHARSAAACQRGSSQRAPSTNAEPLRPAAICTRIDSNRCASMPAYISHRPYTPRTQASSIRSTASSSRTAAQKACGVMRLAECRCGPRARPSMAALLWGDLRGVRSPYMSSFRVATHSEDSHHPASSARRDRHRLPAAGGLQHNEARAALNRNT